MKKTFILILVQLLLLCSGAGAAFEEQSLAVIKSAMPPAPEGWIIAGESRTNPAVVSSLQGSGVSRFRYTIIYKRVARVREDRKQLETVYAESSRRHRDAAKPQIDELIRQQQETALALRKATRRRNAAEEKRLNDQLDENGNKMLAIHEEMDRKIGQDVLPYLLRDSEAEISIAVNEETAELPQGEGLPVPGAAFAAYRKGEPSGAAGWKEGELLVLYGDWRAQGNTLFRAQVPLGGDQKKVCTIKVSITGEQARVAQLLQLMDLKAILSLMK